MTLKSVIRPWVPPVLYEAASRLKVSAGFGSSIRYQPRSSFAVAARDAGEGYHGERLLSKFRAGAADLQDMPGFMSPFLASVAIAASQLKEAPLRVMDFGGGSGHYRAYVETAFRGKIQTNWTVVETPEQADHNSDAAIEFSSSIPSRHFDLAIFSSSLQYVPDWTEPLSKVASDLIYIARTPFAADERSFLQTVISAGERPLSYPGRIINRQELFDLLGRTHDLFASWHFDVLLGELGSFDTPAMLWQRR